MSTYSDELLNIFTTSFSPAQAPDQSDVLSSEHSVMLMGDGEEEAQMLRDYRLFLASSTNPEPSHNPDNTADPTSVVAPMPFGAPYLSSSLRFGDAQLGMGSVGGQNCGLFPQDDHRRSGTSNQILDDLNELSLVNFQRVDDSVLDSLLFNQGQTAHFASASSSNTVIGDQAPHFWPTTGFQLSLPNATSTSGVQVGSSQTSEDGRIFKGRKRVQHSPYDQTQRPRTINQSTNVAAWASRTIPLPLPDGASASPSVSRGVISSVEDRLLYTDYTYSANPKINSLKNRDEHAEVATGSMLPVSSTPEFPQQTFAEEKRARKRKADTERNKALNVVGNKFKVLFPARTLLESKEMAVKVIKYIKASGSVSKHPNPVAIWWLQSDEGGASSTSRAHHGAVNRLMNGEKDRKSMKKRADAARTMVLTVLNDELRKLFPSCSTRIEAMTAALNFLAYAKANDIPPVDPLVLENWVLQQQIEDNHVVIPSPFFEPT